VEKTATGFGLRTFALFDALAPEKLDGLARQCAWRSFGSGQRIISREAADSDVYLLVGGRVRVTAYSAEGRQVTFTDVAAGEIFGDLSAIDDAPRSADVLGLDDGLLACMPAGVFRRLLAEEPLIAGRILCRMAHLVRRLSARVFDLSTLGVQNRIHAELLRLARQAGVARNAARIDPAPKHAEIASQVSTYREQVTRELSALAKAGVVGKQDGALWVRDFKLLEKMVQNVRSGA
jgi:CRP/FNR family transcriptional regulator, cyclic AMP receptor protein